jgi:23S rRNA pseudouridine2605 synthase
MELRLSLFLARAGIASRRGADALIAEGRVTVNGDVEKSPGSRVILGKDHVKVNGKIVSKLVPPVYLILHKPAGCVTTASDPQGRTTVFHYLKRVKARVESVGRLDYDTEGLLLFTNDGELAAKLASPAFKVAKTYRAKVKGNPNREAMKMLRDGVVLDRRKTLPAEVKKVKSNRTYTWLRITIREGKNRQVRRMFQSVCHPVVRLRREEFGPLELTGLAPGRFRYLETDEISLLKKEVKK